MTRRLVTRRVPFTPNLYAVQDARTDETFGEPQSWEDAEKSRKLLQALEDAKALEDYAIAVMMSA
jgi:hypothetical protein